MKKVIKNKNKKAINEKSIRTWFLKIQVLCGSSII